jgi:hypothetical protein
MEAFNGVGHTCVRGHDHTDDLRLVAAQRPEQRQAIGVRQPEVEERNAGRPARGSCPRIGAGRRRNRRVPAPSQAAAQRSPQPGVVVDDEDHRHMRLRPKAGRQAGSDSPPPAAKSLLVDGG